ncbi:MAG TPA: hypothetical protein VJ508_15990, partial [Saprospiraceae bacterium]|nr:hypothetical protein [Saprospiraceae bacterium]
MKPILRLHVVLFSCYCLSLLSCSTNHTWHSVGPYKQDQFFSHNLDCAGEIDAMAFSENYDGEATSAMYIAGPGSGVWRSTNFMSSDPVWVPLTDHIPIYSELDPETDMRIHQDINNISTIAVDPSFPRRIYAGTVSSYSVILRSDDGGKNWSIIDANAFGNKVGVSKIVVDPTGILYVAGAGGIWKQDSPAGNTFTNIALKANPSFHDVEYHDMVFSSNGIGQPISLYVAVIDRNTPLRPQSGIWLFENGSWSKMNMELFNLQSLRFQYEDINRIKLYA